MSFCQALEWEWDSTSKCGVDVHEGSLNFCEKHREQYRALTREYKQASKEAIELGIAVAKIKVQRIQDVGDAIESQFMVEKYIERLESAIHGREEHHNKFFSGPDGPHQHFLDVLKKKQREATCLLDSLKLKVDELGNPQRKTRRIVRLMEQPTQTYGGAANTSSAAQARFLHTHQESLKCEAKLPLRQQCTAERSPGHPYCPAHLEEWRALRIKLDSATRRSGLLRNQILYKVRRLNENLGQCPFVKDMVWLVDAYIEALDKEAHLIMQSERRFTSEPYGSPRPHDCAERRAKAVELQSTLSPGGRLYAALAIIILGVYVHYIAGCLGMHAKGCQFLGFMAGMAVWTLVKRLPEV